MADQRKATTPPDASKEDAALRAWLLLTPTVGKFEPTWNNALKTGAWDTGRLPEAAGEFFSTTDATEETAREPSKSEE